ncbi:MAG: histidine--tRNA ligase [Desulfurococcales archaeon]|nr:histidine--tRNA ligase [Desulfurococcales archaeon]
MKVRPPRGFRDFTPDIMILRKDLIARLERVFRRYGYDPIDTPALEYWETLAGKYGEEAENRLIWRFEDPWSGREYALRYDLTVPLARFIASHRDITLPFKRYHIGPVWRHEEPQRGRYREFYQCDADIVGSPYPEADAEIVNLAVDALKALGFEEGFEVRINDRRLLRGIYEVDLGVSDPTPLYRVIDKLDKIGVEGVRKELERLGLAQGIVEKVLSLITIKLPLHEGIAEIRSRYGGNANNHIIEALDHLDEMASYIKSDANIVLDMSLVRGLDYYTGPIVEVVLREPRIGSVAGGGRYDNLIGIFLGRSIPATGVSIGIERIIDAGLELGIYNLSKRTYTQVQVIVLDRSSYSYAWRVADKIRNLGYNVSIDLARLSEKAQRKKARRLGIKVLAYIGAQEERSGTVTFYNTETGERVTVSLSEAELSSILGGFVG